MKTRPVLAALTLLASAASPAAASTSSWSYGKWDIVLAPEEDILVLVQEGRNIEVQARSESGSDIRLIARAPDCGEAEISLRAFTIPRSAWERRPARDRVSSLKAVFNGWSEQANLLCPVRTHRLDLRRFEAALRQFDGQLARGEP